MQFDLVECEIVQRLSRFVAKVKINNQEMLVHIRNTGRLPELLEKGAIGLLERKYGGKYNWHLKAVRKNDFYVYIDSLLAPKLLLEYITKTKLFDVKSLKLEPRYNKHHKFDILINDDILIETKSVNLVKNDIAMFPDAPTIRGTKHIELLKNIYKDKSYKPFVVFVIQRPDAKGFTPNYETDKDFSKSLIEAKNMGLNILCFDCYTSSKEIYIRGEVSLGF